MPASDDTGFALRIDRRGFFFCATENGDRDIPLPNPHQDEGHDEFISRCVSEVFDEFDSDPQRVAVCESQWSARSMSTVQIGSTAGSGISANARRFTEGLMDANRILESLSKRTTNGRYGIGTADRYFRSIETCFDGGFCPTKLFGKATQRQWRDALKDAERTLVYCDDEMGIGEFRKDGPAGLTNGAVLDFDAVITTTRKDRDGDVLESSGAKLDPRAPLLFYHIPIETIGKLVMELGRNNKHLSAKLAIINSEMGRDAAQLVEFGALRISHGFRPFKADPIEGKDEHGLENGWHIREFEIMEVSLVSVPSNVDAVITAFSRGKLHSPLIKGWAERQYSQRSVQGVGGDFSYRVKIGDLEEQFTAPTEDAVQRMIRAVNREDVTGRPDTPSGPIQPIGPVTPVAPGGGTQNPKRYDTLSYEEFRKIHGINPIGAGEVEKAGGEQGTPVGPLHPVGPSQPVWPGGGTDYEESQSDHQSAHEEEDKLGDYRTVLDDSESGGEHVVPETFVKVRSSARLPKFSDTEETDWKKPNLRDFIAGFEFGDVSSWDDLSAAQKSRVVATTILGDVQDSFNESLVFPVVSPRSGHLNRNALNAVRSIARGGRGGANVSEDAAESAFRMAGKLLEDEFDVEIPDEEQFVISRLPKEWSIIRAVADDDLDIILNVNVGGEPRSFVPLDVYEKRGRTLSAKNEESLRDAVEELAEALKVPDTPRAAKALVRSAKSSVSGVLKSLGAAQDDEGKSIKEQLEIAVKRGVFDVDEARELQSHLTGFISEQEAREVLALLEAVPV